MRGYGHRVGMSQYGANAIARLGFDYQTILRYYYRGAKIETRPLCKGSWQPLGVSENSQCDRQREIFALSKTFFFAGILTYFKEKWCSAA